ncbi:type II toxin-antitoxin system VapC family toxin [Paracoccus pantotrophus]|uniref:type II toxin-antitoxin system VapC family toxin n=1 Tax=Paracoccus pantotrophus TaxID=82367 RepID=UPI000E091958|nr:type II toxin-antitoxin system VapC family toxin [Paracoccus pantotrophus]RDD99723.1 type II toxin-antitoxin system VapC family toxin [Paracoccus pantotrophus]WGR64915.1 type II toxin-antitoxin system VapC family toxin [Paracoccus pantotrophus]
MIILDTNVLSEILRPAPEQRVIDWLAAQDGATVYLTAITEAELRHGVAILAAGRRRDSLAVMIDQIIREDFAGRVLPFDSPAAEAFAAIGASRRAIGSPILHADCQIAAIARVHGATVGTRNTPDFADCGIDLINPWNV